MKTFSYVNDVLIDALYTSIMFVRKPSFLSAKRKKLENHVQRKHSNFGSV